MDIERHFHEMEELKNKFLNEKIKTLSDDLKEQKKQNKLLLEVIKSFGDKKCGII